VVLGATAADKQTHSQKHFEGNVLEEKGASQLKMHPNRETGLSIVDSLRGFVLS
jgi:hypothetical protein